MIRPNALPLRTALRATRPRSTCISVQQQKQSFGVSALHHADDKSQSFKTQLYESTQQRLRRERADQERFSQYQTQSPGGRYAALMFGMHRFLGTPGQQ